MNIGSTTDLYITPILTNVCHHCWHHWRSCNHGNCHSHVPLTPISRRRWFRLHQRQLRPGIRRCQRFQQQLKRLQQQQQQLQRLQQQQLQRLQQLWLQQLRQWAHRRKRLSRPDWSTAARPPTGSARTTTTRQEILDPVDRCRQKGEKPAVWHLLSNNSFSYHCSLTNSSFS